MALVAVGITSGIRESQIGMYSADIGVRSGTFAACAVSISYFMNITLAIINSKNLNIFSRLLYSQLFCN